MPKTPGQESQQSNKNVSNQRRKPKQSRSREKYLAVLEACTQVLARSGYKKATVLQLSLVSDVAVPTIYQYFPNKEAIVIAWFDSIVDKVLQATVASAESMDDRELASQIEPWVRRSLDLIITYRPIVRRVFIDLPSLLSTKLVNSMERKTIAFVRALKTPAILALDQDEVDRTIALLVRCIVGYLITLVLSDAPEVEAATEARELSTMIGAHLRERGLLTP